MKKHETTMKDVIRMRCYQNGLTLGALSKKTGIGTATITRHMADGNWSREQVQEMHRYLHFTPEDTAIYFEGR